MDIDFKRYYDLETYLFTEVTSHFKNNGYISAFDFFCIVIWKANRSKTKIAKRLIQLNKGSLDETIKYISTRISAISDRKKRLELLLLEFGFQLPMASAILTVLYPEEYTIYDIRVCESIGKYQDLKNITNYEQLWNGYIKYIEEVIIMTPPELNLRDKDRYLWGKSFYKQLQNDIQSSFDIENQE